MRDCRHGVELGRKCKDCRFEKDSICDLLDVAIEALETDTHDRQEFVKIISCKGKPYRVTLVVE